MPPASTALLAALLGTLVLLLVGRHRGRLRDTTLAAPWAWCVVAVAIVTICEVIAMLTGPEPALEGGRLAAFRFIAHVVTYCPMMALLGAKRPQNRAWNFVVVSFWIVLSLPAVISLTLDRSPFIVEPIWSWFLSLWMAAGILNYLPTRYWPAALFYGGGQFALLVPHLPRLETMRNLLGGGTAGPAVAFSWPLASLLLFGLAALSVQLLSYWPARSDRGTSSPVDRLWRDFRNGYGALWGLRVAERINASATLYNWGVRLQWDGLHPASQPNASPTARDCDPDLPPETYQAVERDLCSLLRRFVSADWIDRRLAAVD